MIARFIMIGVTAAAFATATPLTITFSGTANGVLGSNSFTQANFTITFTSDTTNVSRLPPDPTQPVVDWTTAPGTSAMFSIFATPMSITTMVPTYSGTFTDNQSVFAHPSPENDLGIWHNPSCAPGQTTCIMSQDWLAKQDPAFASYNLMSSIGPISTGNNGSPGQFTTCAGGMSCGFSTNDGNFYLSNVTALTVLATVSSNSGGGGSGGGGGGGTGGGGTGATPEPSTLLLFALGIGGITAGRLFRKV